MLVIQQCLLILFGTSLGFLSSIGTTLVSNLIKNKGEVKVYYKVVYSKINQCGTWGFRSVSNELIFEIPLWVELYNTSDSVKIIRDLSVLLFQEGKEITQMTQINKTGENLFYGNQGAYSFVLQPRNISKYNLYFLIKKDELGNNCNFDEIRLRYFDEKDKEQISLLKKINEPWVIGDLERNKKWKLMQ